MHIDELVRTYLSLGLSNKEIIKLVKEEAGVELSESDIQKIRESSEEDLQILSKEEEEEIMQIFQEKMEMPEKLKRVMDYIEKLMQRVLEKENFVAFSRLTDIWQKLFKFQMDYFADVESRLDVKNVIEGVKMWQRAILETFDELEREYAEQGLELRLKEKFARKLRDIKQRYAS